MSNFIGSVVVVLFLVLMTKACVGAIAGPDPKEEDTTIVDR